MQIDIPTVAEHAEYLALVNAEIRPGRAKSTAWDDFPLILHEANRPGTLVVRSPEGGVEAGIACLIGDFRTSCGIVAVAGIGSVVTRPDCRGRGLSSALQDALLARLTRQNVPLAVLWAEEAAIYAGRGFRPAGWEFHLELGRADLPAAAPDGLAVREFRPADVPAVEALYREHPYGTVRRPGDSALLYGMPGTRGLVLAAGEGPPLAAVFCGKGADFPGYVPEWSGPGELVLPLLARARDLGLAGSVLVPPGTERLAELLVARGAAWLALPAGLWKVLGAGAQGWPPELAALGVGLPADDPTAWLGGIDADGTPRPGPLTLAVWGFDSV